MIKDIKHYGYRFIKEDDDGKIIYAIKGTDCTLDFMLTSFRDFLRGCGYQLEDLDLVEVSNDEQ